MEVSIVKEIKIALGESYSDVRRNGLQNEAGGSSPFAAEYEFLQSLSRTARRVSLSDLRGQVAAVTCIADCDGCHWIMPFRNLVSLSSLVGQNSDHLMCDQAERRSFQYQVAIREPEIMNGGAIWLVIPYELQACDAKRQHGSFLCPNLVGFHEAGKKLFEFLRVFFLRNHITPGLLVV